jgi:hypothetical protein
MAGMLKRWGHMPLHFNQLLDYNASPIELPVSKEPSQYCYYEAIFSRICEKTICSDS